MLIHAYISVTIAIRVHKQKIPIAYLTSWYNSIFEFKLRKKEKPEAESSSR